MFLKWGLAETLGANLSKAGIFPLAQNPFKKLPVTQRSVFKLMVEI
jgi:hypothetical protein